MHAPLPIFHILARARRLAAHHVSLEWICAHVLGVWIGIVVLGTLLDMENWRGPIRYVWAGGWWLLVVMLSSTCSAGLACVGWSDRRGETVTFGDCARAVMQRRGTIAREAFLTAVMGVAGLLTFGVGFVWAICVRCTVVPACVCESDVSAREAAERGREMMRGHLGRGMALFALVSPLVIAAPYAAIRTVGYLATLHLDGIVGRAVFALGGASLMAGLSVYALVGAATYVELRGERPATGTELARVFE